MKKNLLITLLAFLPLLVHAEVYKFTTTHFCYKTLNNGRWTKFSDWEESKILVVINTSSDRITIYSPEVQEFDVVEWFDKYTDSDGADNFKWLCVDQDGLRCHVRNRILKDKSEQLYIEYNDVVLVYTIVSR